MNKKDRFALFCIPTRDPMVHIKTAQSIMEAGADLGKNGIRLSVQYWSGDPLISHARNMLLAIFMQKFPEATDLIWVDDDVSWHYGSMSRLMQHDADMVCGAYRVKRDLEHYPVNYLDKDVTVDKDNNVARVSVQPDPVTGLIEVKDIPFGLCRMTRECAQKLWDAAADKPFRHSSAPEIECRVVFDVVYEDGQYYGEDYVVCRKWRAMGGKVWVDPFIPTTHHGRKDYEGNLDKYLRGESMQPQQINGDAIQRAFKGMIESMRPTSGKAA